jgi:hypothetical protein
VNCETRYLLIVACSQRKRSDPYLLPAIERYDGGNFRVLRKLKREKCWPKKVDVLILSAKYGLIEADEPIAHYEQRMDRERARRLKSQTISILHKYTEQQVYDEVYVELGQDYFPAIGDMMGLFKNSVVIYAEGRIGERLAKLKQWLIAKYMSEDTTAYVS